MNVNDPLERFRQWYEQARRTPGIDKPHAMALATVGEDGRPACRIVLLSSYDERGFVFHTNYASRKGEEIARHPWVALTFWWDPLGYQVRIEGQAKKTSPEESDAYFAQRPRGHQLGAWASEQSRPIAAYEELLERMRRFEARFAGAPVPRPPYWGGFRVVPQTIEFWEHRENRLHERILYERVGESGGWRLRRLAP
jgi:pyridoxamine 5'-phosphate oxidase